MLTVYYISHDTRIFAGLPEQSAYAFLATITPPTELQKAIHIKHTVCNYLNVEADNTESSYRGRTVTECRQICMYITLRKTKLGQKAVGKLYGNRDHTTVIYARDTVNDLMDSNNGFKEKIKTIEKLFDNY